MRGILSSFGSDMVRIPLDPERLAHSAEGASNVGAGGAGECVLVKIDEGKRQQLIHEECWHAAGSCGRSLRHDSGKQ